MNTHDLTQLKSFLSIPRKIVIVTHKNPDGDAIGSSLGLYHYLLKEKHQVFVMTPNDYPPFLKWIPGSDTILKYDTQTSESDTLIKDADIIFTLDLNALHRTGNMAPSLEASKAIKIMIDHHQSPDDYATYTYSDSSMSSTCEMIYHYMNKLGAIDVIDTNIATCLYVGIMTDTGSFRFSSTTSTTHKIIAELIDKGANNTHIHNHVYDANSYERLQLLGCALGNLKVLPEFKTAYITLTQDELYQFNYKKGDTEGIVNYALSLEGIVLAAIFIEDKQERIIKISLRSKGLFSVNELSRAHFEGGGHENAAGGKSVLALGDTVDKFVNLLPQYKKALNNE